MSRGGNPGDARLHQLLAGRALGDLSPQEESELAAATLSPEQIRLGEELEITVAVIDQMQTDAEAGGDAADQESLPAEIRREIARQAIPFLQANRGGTGEHPLELDRQPASLDSRTVDRRPLRPTGDSNWRWREVLAWVACAASLLIAVGLWQRQASVGRGPPDLVAARADLLREDPRSLQVPFGPGKTPFPGEVQGDVVWSTRQQQGYLRLQGIPINDPAREQYQLWIIDPARDDEPIDGGVFDIATAGQVIIPIDAKLPAIDPQAFAITIEKPGGVVVSSQERLPLLAVVAN